MHRSLKTHYIMSKKSSLPFTTEVDVLKPLLSDPVVFSLFLVKFQQEFSNLYLNFLHTYNSSDVSEEQKDQIRLALPLLSPYFLLGRSFQELFPLKEGFENTCINDYSGLLDAYRYIQEYVNNKFRELCQTSELSQQEQH